jgi:hypothetical protein
MILNTINIRQGQQKHPCDQNGEMSQGDFEKKKKKTPLFISCKIFKFFFVKGYEVVSTFKMAAHSPNCGQSYE